MKLESSKEALNKFKSYPDAVKRQMHDLRALIIAVALEMENLHELEETLKWGEPSYLTKYGSTVRIDWKANNPNQFAVYFKCTSKLVPTFKEVFKGVFQFENNRAIIFKINQKVPKRELSVCIRAALNYHKIKYLPLLGL